MKKFLIPSLLLPLSYLLASPEEPNFDEDIKPLLRRHCLKCHGEDEQKAGLNLQTYAAAMKGGSGGEIVVAGRSSQSQLFLAITDPDDDARMPPNKPMIPREQIALIQKWIDTGLRENSGSNSMVAARDTSFQPASGAGNKPENPAMPENLPKISIPEVIRPLPVLALDASPWAPLVAVSGQDHVTLLNTDTEEEIGKLAFPEGVPHVIRFSRDGAVLMVAGGQPVQSGRAVLFDVKTGKRLAEIGDEIDAVLAADLSPDQQLLALGGSGNIVKVHSTVDGALKYRIDKHTDWITAIAFSPDGATLATADRAGGLHLWDAKSGGIRLSLLEHKASIRALDWRSDSRFLASVAEDGHVIWWDVKDGWPTINKPNAHPPQRPPGTFGVIPNGVLAASFGENGQLSTAGRDGFVQLWDEKGNSLKKFPIESGLPISAGLSHDGQIVLGGSSDGAVRFWRLK